MDAHSNIYDINLKYIAGAADIEEELVAEVKFDAKSKVPFGLLSGGDTETRVRQDSITSSKSQKKSLTEDEILQIMSKAHTVAALEAREAEVEHETIGHKSSKKIVDVLVIVTGGTLSMVHTEMGYMTDKGLYKRLKAINCFHNQQRAEELSCDD